MWKEKIILIHLVTLMPSGLTYLADSGFFQKLIRETNSNNHTQEDSGPFFIDLNFNSIQFGKRSGVFSEKHR